MAAEPCWDADLTLPLGDGRLHLALRTDARRVALVGPSGAGKSTCLRMIAGLEPHARGTITVGGERWQGERSRVPAWRRRVGYAPQDAGLFPHASVRENLAWAGATDADLGSIAERLEVAHLLARRPRNLSGGERQRVALGRALLSRPSVLLLDEPFAALDLPLRERVAGVLAAIVAERDLPMVLVAHDAPPAALALEVWTIVDGATRELSP